MNNRERVITTLEHKKPDRVPYNIWFTKEACAKMSAFYGDLDFESKLGNCFVDLGAYDYNYKKIGTNIWEDRFGVQWNRTVDKDIGTVCNCVVNPDNIDEYKFPDPGTDGCFKSNTHTNIPHANSGNFFIVQLGFSLFERAWTLTGMENFLMAMLSDENFANKLLDKILEYNLRWIEKALLLDVDAILFGDDWGCQNGLLMGPKLWSKFIKPKIKKMYQAVKKKGKYVFIHSCGKVDEVFPDLIECGVDLFNPFQPEVMDVFEMKRRYGKSLSFFGGISVQRTLPFGTISETRKEVKILLERIGFDGGYIAAPSHSIPKDAKVENIAAMIDILKNQKKHYSTKYID